MRQIRIGVVVKEAGHGAGVCVESTVGAGKNPVAAPSSLQRPRPRGTVILIAFSHPCNQIEHAAWSILFVVSARKW